MGKFEQLSFWAAPEDLSLLQRELSSRGPAITTSGLIQALIDAFVDFILHADRLTPEEEELVNVCGDRVWEREKRRLSPGSRRVNVTIRPDQAVGIAEVSKGFEMTKSGIIRLLLEMWQEELLDPFLPRRLCWKRVPALSLLEGPAGEKVTALRDLMRARRGRGGS